MYRSTGHPIPLLTLLEENRSLTPTLLFQWEDTKVYASKHFPQAVEKGLLPNNGSFAGFQLKTDPSRVEKVLGIKPKSFEDIIVDLVGQYVELSEKEGAGEKIAGQHVDLLEKEGTGEEIEVVT
jgi:hypothetical protein